jgi:hypothetical protein
MSRGAFLGYVNREDFKKRKKKRQVEHCLHPKDLNCLSLSPREMEPRQVN